MPKRPEPVLTPQDAAWGRWVSNSIESLEKLVASSGSAQTATNKGLAASLDAQARQIASISALQAAMPIQATSIDRTSPISATSSSFVDKASVSIDIPEGKTTASVLAIGAARITDTVTGGLTSSDCRVVIAGDAGGSFPAAKDAAVSQVINVLNATHARTFPVTPGEAFTVTMQVSALNASAFPSSPANFAQIAVVASFT